MILEKSLMRECFNATGTKTSQSIFSQNISLLFKYFYLNVRPNYVCSWYEWNKAVLAVVDKHCRMGISTCRKAFLQ